MGFGEINDIIGTIFSIFSIFISGLRFYANNDLGAILIICGMRFNLLTATLGISFERALYWHRTLGLLFIATMIIHAVASGPDFTGLNYHINIKLLSA
jgi:Ni,Fe-hydrogenase I cytochrome b subunit